MSQKHIKFPKSMSPYFKHMRLHTLLFLVFRMDQLKLKQLLQKEIIESIKIGTTPTFVKNKNNGRLGLDSSIVDHIMKSRLEKVNNNVNQNHEMDAKEMKDQVPEVFHTNEMEDQDPNVFQANERDDQDPNVFQAEDQVFQADEGSKVFQVEDQNSVVFQANENNDTIQVQNTSVQNKCLTQLKKIRSQVKRDRLSEKKKFNSNSKKYKNAIIFELEKLEEYRVNTEVNTNMKIYEGDYVVYFNTVCTVVMNFINY